MIKTVIFDLGGVYFSNGTKNAIEVISSKYGVPKADVEDVLKGDLGTQYRVGAITADQFWDQTKQKWKIETPVEELANIWFEGYKPIEGMPNLVDRLNGAGYEVLFLSDNVQERVDYLDKRYNFLNKFKDGIFSHIVKTRKPDPEIYKMAIEKASNPAEECVYVDDKPPLLEPAKAQGMQAIAFESAEQVEKDLKGLGLEF